MKRNRIFDINSIPKAVLPAQGPTDSPVEIPEQFRRPQKTPVEVADQFGRLPKTSVEMTDQVGRPPKTSVERTDRVGRSMEEPVERADQAGKLPGVRKEPDSIEMTVSAVCSRKDGRQVAYVTFRDGDRYAEGQIPDCHIIRNEGFDEGEALGLEFYMKRELTSLKKMAAGIRLLDAIMK